MPGLSKVRFHNDGEARIDSRRKSVLRWKYRSAASCSGRASRNRNPAGLSPNQKRRLRAFAWLDLPPAFEGAAEGEFIGEFQAAADGQPVGNARHAHASRRKEFVQVKARGIAFHV